MTVRISKPKINVREKLTEVADKVNFDQVVKGLGEYTGNVGIGAANPEYGKLVVQGDYLNRPSNCGLEINVQDSYGVSLEAIERREVGGNVGHDFSVTAEKISLNGMLHAPANIGTVWQNQEIVDTGIYVGDLNKYACGIFEITVSGNPNHAGSGYYRASSIYHLHVTTGWNGANLNTMLTGELLSRGNGGSSISYMHGTFVLWDETTQTEYTAYSSTPNSCPTRDANHQLRIKVSGHSITDGIRVTVKCLHRESLGGGF